MPSNEEVTRRLEELERLRKQNPLWFYNHPELSSKPPYQKQLRFHSLRTKIKFFSGGNQAGKTTSGLADDLIQALDEKDVPPHLRQYKIYHPPFYCRVLTESVSVLELVIYEKLRELIPQHALLGDTWRTSYDKLLRVLRFKNGSTFQFMTYEQDVGKMGGATVHRIHYDEEPPLDVRIENRLRTMKLGGDEVFSQTPLKGLSWAYDALWVPAVEQGVELEPGFFYNKELSIGLVLVDMDDNPYLSEDEKTRALQGLSEEERTARKEGKFVHFAGKIYNDFDPATHCIPPFGPSPESEVVVGIDPGLRNETGVVWVSVDPDETLVVFDELYMKGETIKTVSEEIKKVNARYDIVPRMYVIDPSSRNRSRQTGLSDQYEYSTYGIYTIPGHSPVEAGINRVKERVQSGKLLVTDNCHNLIREFRNYRWKETRTGEDGQPKPVKTQDHLLDALRYVCMARPYAPIRDKYIHETPLERMMREDRERTATVRQRHAYGGGIFS